jgi:hypothetical protein
LREPRVTAATCSLALCIHGNLGKGTLCMYPSLRIPTRWPLPSLSPSAIAVAVSISHHHCLCRRPFPRVVALARQEFNSNNISKECLPFLFCLDSGRRTDQSRMTDQTSSGNGQRQHWVASGEQQAASGGSGWQQGGQQGGEQGGDVA